MAARITGASVLCPAGCGVEQLWASVRAGLSRIGNSGVMDERGEPIRMALVPEDALDPALPPQVESLPWPSRARRMLRLGAPALRSVLEHAGPGPLRLFLGLPQLDVAEASWMKGFALALAKTAGTTLDAPNCRVVPAGRAAALVGLELALDALARDPAHAVVVGGVDTFFDPALLAELDAERRILGPEVSDGFIPGEGAGFLVLRAASAAAADSSARPASSVVEVRAAASVSDPGHRSGAEPALGEGLANALERLRSQLSSPSQPIESTFAGLTGEAFDAKQWGVARARHADLFSPGMTLTHPADCCGDAGAALGAVLLCTAAAALSAGHRRGPALIWAASDGESRACALMSPLDR